MSKKLKTKKSKKPRGLSMGNKLPQFHAVQSQAIDLVKQSISACLHDVASMAQKVNQFRTIVLVGSQRLSGDFAEDYFTELLDVANVQIPERIKAMRDVAMKLGVPAVDNDNYLEKQVHIIELQQLQDDMFNFMTSHEPRIQAILDKLNEMQAKLEREAMEAAAAAAGANVTPEASAEAEGVDAVDGAEVFSGEDGPMDSTVDAPMDTPAHPEAVATGEYSAPAEVTETTGCDCDTPCENCQCGASAADVPATGDESTQVPASV